jgi:hypothetical protein
MKSEITFGLVKKIIMIIDNCHDYRSGVATRTIDSKKKLFDMNCHLNPTQYQVKVDVELPEKDDYQSKISFLTG